MSIFVTVEDENGDYHSDVVEIQRIQRHFAHIEGSLCSQFISEKEDTAFNKTQNDLLLKELLSLKAKDLKKDEAEELAALLKLSNRVKEKTGLYIKFYGEAHYRE